MYMFSDSPAQIDTELSYGLIIQKIITFVLKTYNILAFRTVKIGWEMGGQHEEKY